LCRRELVFAGRDVGDFRPPAASLDERPRPKNPARATKSLEATLWDAADELRGKMDSLPSTSTSSWGLIFLKYVSDTFMVRHDELARLVDDQSSDYFMPNEAAKSVLQEHRRKTFIPRVPALGQSRWPPAARRASSRGFSAGAHTLAPSAPEPQAVHRFFHEASIRQKIFRPTAPGSQNLFLD
jgi:hypothetical protein